MLRTLEGQETRGLFSYSVVVVDNDAASSAERCAGEFAARAGIPVKYCVEPRQNIALARNRAVSNASGEFIVFIDDDEFTTRDWLVTLFTACEKFNVDGVLGPVKPHFDVKPPEWVVKGKFYDRPSYPTGLVIDGKKGRTGNTFLRSKVLQAAGDEPFRPEFRTGEDQDFFTRMIDRGFQFIWCHEAMAFEVVPPVRWQRRFMFRRALLRGASAVLQRRYGALEIIKSAIAIPGYTLLLPIALCAGQHRFMSLSIKLCDHLGKFLALINCNPVREAYVVE